MSGALIQVGLDDVAARGGLEGMRARLSDLRPMLGAIAAAGVASTRRRFQAGRGPDGAPWKKGRKKTGQTLIASGLLLRSISDRPPTRDSVEWGSNRVYAAIHQFGGTIRPVRGKYLKFKVEGAFVQVASVTLPARPYLGVSAEDRVEFVDIARRYAAGELEG